MAILTTFSRNNAPVAAKPPAFSILTEFDDFKQELARMDARIQNLQTTLEDLKYGDDSNQASRGWFMERALSRKKCQELNIQIKQRTVKAKGKIAHYGDCLADERVLRIGKHYSNRRVYRALYGLRPGTLRDRYLELQDYLLVNALNEHATRIADKRLPEMSAAVSESFNNFVIQLENNPHTRINEDPNSGLYKTYNTFMDAIAKDPSPPFY